MKNVSKLLTRLVLLFALSTVLFLQESQADIVATIGTQTATSSYPFHTFNRGARVQYMYTAAELTAAGMVAGPVTKLGYNCITLADTPNLADMVFSMKNSTNNGLTAFDPSGFTTCWTGPAMPGYSFVVGWNTFTFTTPFIWDGTSNIVIQVCYGNTGWGVSTGNLVAVYPTGYANPPYGTLLTTTDVAGTGCALAAAASYSANKPVIQLTMVTGTLNGVISSTNPGGPLAGAIVTSYGFVSAATGISGAYTMSAPAGTSNFTASATGYTPVMHAVNVPAGGTATQNFLLSPLPAVMSGHVYNIATTPPTPVKGAKIVVTAGAITYVTYSLDGGAYSLTVNTFGSFTVTVSKAGFDDLVIAAIAFPPGGVIAQDFNLLETANPASQPFTAVLNGAATTVNLNWGLPKGDYELIYDDGIQELSTVWGNAGNMNAMKFTPLNYPVTVVGGNVNIGAAADYPVGTLPASLAPFKMQVYDATGAGGAPGTAIGDPVTVTPTTFGWNHFTIPGINITSGNFYLVMIQVGTPPAAARIGVDTTNNQLRSYSKFVTGGGSWLPGIGNFMIRAVVNGIGGPIDSPESVYQYQVYRLLEGQESTPGVWNSIGIFPSTSATDPSWQSFPDGPYRWAVKAHYTNNRWSVPIFSNVLGKNWTVTVTVNVSLSCDTLSIVGTKVTLRNLDYGVDVDSTYTANLTTSHTVVFHNVWKGNYEIKVERFNFMIYLLASTPIFTDKTFDITVSQQKTPPSNMNVDGQSAIATWDPPVNDWFGLFETWDSGSFATNGWTADQDPAGYFGEQWYINASYGNPAPSAEFGYDIGVLNYNLSLTSASLTPVAGTRLLSFSYDIYYLNDVATSASGMKVEILDGTTWKLLKTYSAATSIAWKTETFNIDAYKAKTFKIRFHAFGDDAYNIMEWRIDNIKVVGKNEDITPCILAYNVYLTDLTTNNTILSGQPTVPEWKFPSAQLVYGRDYRACVTALYGSGESAIVPANNQCDNFNARFLCPPTKLTGIPIESTAYLTWTAPNCTPGHIVDYILDQGMITYGYSCSGAPAIEGLGNFFTIPAGTSGLIKSFDIYTFNTATQTGAITYQMDVYSPTGVLLGTSATFTPVGATGTSGWNTITMPDVPFNGNFFGCLRYNITNPAWFGCALAYDTMYSIHHNNTGGYFENTPPAPWFWQLNSVAGAKGAFVLRAKAFVFDGKKEVIFGGGEAPVTIGTSSSNNRPTAQVNNNADYTALAPSNVPPLQQGYTIWRDGVQIDAVPSNSTLEYYDYNLPSGIYSYEVKAYYDVTPVNPPASGHDNSLGAGPVLVTINFGRSLPFYEPWDNGTFAFNGWDHQTNWTVNTGFGNPLPCADFSWQPIQAAPYSLSLTSTTLTAAPYSCAKIWLDFDYKLVNQNNTGNEKLAVEVKERGVWFTKLILTNDNSVDWTSKHIQLNGASSQAFQVRFRAYGEDSRDILHWYVDNIKIYAVCNPPTHLSATQSHNNVTLSWAAPLCPKDTYFSLILDDGGWENGWRGVGAVEWFGNLFQMTGGGTGVLTDFDLYFITLAGVTTPRLTHIDVFDLDGNLLTSSAPFLQLGDAFQNVTVAPVPITGSFYGMVSWDAVNGSSPYSEFLAEDENGPHAADDLGYNYNGTTFVPISTWSGGTDQGPFLLRANGIIFGGKSTSSITFNPGHSPVSNAKPGIISPEARANTSGDSYSHRGVGLIMNKDIAANSLQGYNVYRTDETGAGVYHKRNTAVVTQLTYADVIPIAAQGTYKYYVTDVFNDSITNAFLCESSSDTITLHFPVVGVNEISSGQISIYPNPATDVVNIASSDDIKTVEVLNYIGQIVYSNNNVNLKNAQLNVSTFKAGVYFVKITTTIGIKTTKITVTH